MAHRCFKSKKHRLLDKIKILILSLRGYTLKLKTIFKKQEKLAKKYNGGNEEYAYCSNYPLDDIYNRHKKEHFSQTVKLSFNGELFPCPKNYHEVLTTLFNDYMTLPKESERISKHIN